MGDTGSGGGVAKGFGDNVSISYGPSKMSISSYCLLEDFTAVLLGSV